MSRIKSMRRVVVSAVISVAMLAVTAAQVLASASNGSFP